MKKIINQLLLLLFLGISASVLAQTQQETIHKTGSFNSTGRARVLSVQNIHGFVHVEAYPGDKVDLVAEKIISAKNISDVEKGMREVEVKLIQAKDSIYVFVDAPFIFRKQSRSRNMVINLEEIAYTYQVDLTLRVPANLNLVISTVSNGEVMVNNVIGDIKANHVNGPVTLKGVAGKAEASTVNGRIDVYFKQNPTADSRFKTINGNVNVYYAPKFNATVAFKTMNGQFYTDLTEVEITPVRVIKNSENKGDGTTYKIDKSNGYKVGTGGPALSFETLNGNIYLKKN